MPRSARLGRAAPERLRVVFYLRLRLSPRDTPRPRPPRPAGQTSIATHLAGLVAAGAATEGPAVGAYLWGLDQGLFSSCIYLVRRNHTND